MYYGENDLMKELGMEYKNIKGKTVFIFESHHYALYPWALVKRKHQDSEINLLSFDYHTDTHEPFLSYMYKHGLDQEHINGMIRNINYLDDNSLKIAIYNLIFDEHIKTAVKCGILEHAFIISQSGKETPISYEEKERIDNLWNEESIRQILSGEYSITPRMNRTYPPSDIYVTDFNCENDESILNDDFLREQFEMFSRMNNIIQKDGTILSKYILDIDLDYFTFPDAVRPEEHNIFSSLVKNSEAITIAKESDCVDMCSDGRTNSRELLNGILSLIEDIL